MFKQLQPEKKKEKLNALSSISVCTVMEQFWNAIIEVVNVLHLSEFGFHSIEETSFL